jgi:2-oxoglutarate ferredoxin oxidoreductase subunit beta
MDKTGNKVFTRPRSLKNVQSHFCSGCHHGLLHRLVAEALDKFNVREDTIGVASVGCSVFMYTYFDIDVVEAPHGRASAVATGVKRAMKDKIVFTYQGDGDLAAIGTSEIIHAANRGENITVIFVNNAIYGMTGGQMAPTTLLGMKTSTSPYGRDLVESGYPIKMAEMLATLEGTAFVARVAVDRPANLMRAKKIIHTAFEYQVKGIGFSFVEAVAACPTNWNMTPAEANKKIEDEMIPYYPLGILKERKEADHL